MIKFTTPNLKCTIPNDIELDYILFTIKSRNTLIERTIQKEEIEDGVFNVLLTQEETGELVVNSTVKVQLNIMSGDTRMATNIIEAVITENLHNEVI